MKKGETVNLGDEVEDTVSGFKGIAIGRFLFLHGCTRIGVQPKVDKDGKHLESCTFDEPQLKILKRAVVEPATEENRASGGPAPYRVTQNEP